MSDLKRSTFIAKSFTALLALIGIHKVDVAAAEEIYPEEVILALKALQEPQVTYEYFNTLKRAEFYFNKKATEMLDKLPPGTWSKACNPTDGNS